MIYYLGLITMAYYLFVAASFLYNWLLRPSAIPRFLRSDRSPWALVTGASDGIGFGFCQELAAQGFHIILHGRNRQKLDLKASDLSKAFPGLQTRLFTADASQPASFDALLETIKDDNIHLKILINNVGGTSNLPQQFMTLQDHSQHDIDATIALNAGFATNLTATLLPTLMANEPSLILNIGSLAALGMPRLSVYAGAKGFLESHSEALQTELRAQGRDITVHAVSVGSVRSGGYGKGEEGRSMFVPSARGMARATLAKVGAGDVVITPYLPHAVSKWFVRNLPRMVREYVFIAAIKDAEAKYLKET